MHVHVSNAARPRVIDDVISQIGRLNHVGLVAKSGALYGFEPAHIGNALFVES